MLGQARLWKIKVTDRGRQVEYRTGLQLLVVLARQDGQCLEALQVLLYSREADLK